jgi:hypothetical protein
MLLVRSTEMSDLMTPSTDDETISVLMASGKLKRKRKTSAMDPYHASKVRRSAEKELRAWREEGLSDEAWDLLHRLKSPLISKFGLNLKTNVLQSQVYQIYFAIPPNADIVKHFCNQS